MWDVKAPTHCPQRVGDVVPGVIAYLKFTLTKGAYLLISFIKITCKLHDKQSHWQKSFNHFYVFPKRPEVRSHFYGICEFVVVVVFLFFSRNNVTWFCYATLMSKRVEILVGIFDLQGTQQQ